MKSFIVAACIVACVYATTSDESAQVLRSDYQQSPEGNYQFAYETDNGITGQAKAVLKPVGKDEVAFEVTGSNSYTAPDGQVISVEYVANEFGFNPVGAHLPTAPPPQPYPEYIQRSLEYIAAHPYTEKN